MTEILNFLEVLEALKTKALQGQLEAIDIQKQINTLSDEFIQQELQMEFDSGLGCCFSHSVGWACAHRDGVG